MKRKTQVEYNQKYLNQFFGSYVYIIRHKTTQQIKRIGQTDNFVRRYGQYFHDHVGYNELSLWFVENDIDRSEYEMVVLDLMQYDTFDYDDRLIIEKSLILYHSQNEQELINDRKTNLNAYQLERLEYINGILDYNFVPYTQLKVEKMAKKIA